MISFSLHGLNNGPRGRTLVLVILLHLHVVNGKVVALGCRDGFSSDIDLAIRSAAVLGKRRRGAGHQPGCSAKHPRSKEVGQALSFQALKQACFWKDLAGLVDAYRPIGLFDDTSVCALCLYTAAQCELNPCCDVYALNVLQGVHTYVRSLSDAWKWGWPISWSIPQQDHCDDGAWWGVTWMSSQTVFGLTCLAFKMQAVQSNPVCSRSVCRFVILSSWFHYHNTITPNPQP